MDPGETEYRKPGRLKQKKYILVGPNFCWHVYGYYKSKPCNLPMYNYDDGFSQKIWSWKFEEFMFQ